MTYWIKANDVEGRKELLKNGWYYAGWQRSTDGLDYIRYMRNHNAKY